MFSALCLEIQNNDTLYRICGTQREQRVSCRPLTHSRCCVMLLQACKYFEIENREVPVSADCLVMSAERAKPFIDENTIGGVWRTYSTLHSVRYVMYHSCGPEMDKNTLMRVPYEVSHVYLQLCVLTRMQHSSRCGCATR